MTSEPYAGHGHPLVGPDGRSSYLHCYDPLCLQAPEEAYRAARLEQLHEQMRRTVTHIPSRVALRLFAQEPPELGPLGLPR